MKQRSALQGIIPPVITVLDEHGQLDTAGMGRMIDYLTEAGVHGLFFLGSAGEFFHMSAEQRKQVAEFAIRYTNGRLPVLIGTGSSRTDEAIELSRHAESAGADAAVVLNPYAAKLSDEQLYRHYADIAESVSLPIYIYNYPGLTGQEVKASIVAALAAAYPNIAGVKQTVQQIEPILEVIRDVKGQRPEFAVFAGYDHLLLETLIAGGDGAVPASANFAPHLTCGLYEAYRRSDLAAIAGIQRKLFRIVTEVYPLDSPFFHTIKEAVRASGVDIPTHVMPPARPLSPELLRELLQLLERHELQRILQGS
ncbi:dihydrodipicolinate synthase family protein [Paenibacillus dendritiformis]|uniref:dihydrodipicolinate synthase family protein n=1 Tax=Paenibacillus dendritiformis TaxID=130049 RepID=UPI00105993C6|nr:dihydrodipicolinate synthase family protein [Paenibacillus dendritiformis]TDL56063.1 dihydrodipicolinate synthase family protein [Paenibacillus dendritiformis]